MVARLARRGVDVCLTAGKPTRQSPNEFSSHRPTIHPTGVGSPPFPPQSGGRAPAGLSRREGWRGDHTSESTPILRVGHRVTSRRGGRMVDVARCGENGSNACLRGLALSGSCASSWPRRGRLRAGALTLSAVLVVAPTPRASGLVATCRLSRGGGSPPSSTVGAGPAIVVSESAQAAARASAAASLMQPGRSTRSARVA